MEITPRYTHDCSSCIFLGYYHMYDLYYCTSEHETVIARWSDYGPDYHSGLGFASPFINAVTGKMEVCKPLEEALHRVIVSDLRILVEESIA